MRFDKILVAVGRRPNGNLLDATKAGVNVDERGFINVDKQLRTNVPHIFAIGDVIGQPMLAHKAVHEGHVAAEVISGLKHFFYRRCIPSVAYTDPGNGLGWSDRKRSEERKRYCDRITATFPWAGLLAVLSLQPALKVSLN